MQYSDEDRARWRDEIADAKRTKTREEFHEWLHRRMNVAGCAPAGCQCSCHLPGINSAHVVACCEQTDFDENHMPRERRQEDGK